MEMCFGFWVDFCNKICYKYINNNLKRNDFMHLEMLGITPRKIKQFESKGITTVESLLKLVPKDYYDCRASTRLSPAVDGNHVCVIGTTTSFLNIIGSAKNVLRIWVEDEDGNAITVLWFNQMFRQSYLDSINKGTQVLIFGKIAYNGEYDNYSICNPIIFNHQVEENRTIVPIYKKIAGMSDDYYKETVGIALDKIKVKDYLPASLRDEFNLCEYNADFFRMIHHPCNKEEIEATQRRMIFDDLFYFASKLFKECQTTNNSEFFISKTDVMQKVIDGLPYSLTEDQHNTVMEIVDMGKNGRRINALVQGDVGCGKTIVSFLTMVAFAENGYQAVLMAPTQVLAKQHFEGLSSLVESYGFRVAHFHSGMKTKEKRELIAGVKNGEYHFIVGTHSVFSNMLEYNNLALVITDEEHKFGVEQRDALSEKASSGVHVITMSATPIPRTTAIILYGEDKKIFTISQMPNGRKPVITGIAVNDLKTFAFMRKEIHSGRQCYVVCPLIKDSDSEKMSNVESVDTTYKKLCSFFANDNDIRIGVLTGKQTAEEVANTIASFEKNELQILVSTTVIEVGVNVPNASVITIRNAERFGLAQLHQLRGRVGRGQYQSYCLLCSEDKENERLAVMCSTNNGFEIAEADFKQRGAGDLIGTQQSGDNEYVGLMLKYPNFYLKIKNRVKELIALTSVLSDAN